MQKKSPVQASALFAILFPLSALVLGEHHSEGEKCQTLRLMGAYLFAPENAEPHYC